jgi:hypothetical protein
LSSSTRTRRTFIGALMSRSAVVYRRKRCGDGILEAGTSSTSDGTSSLVLVGMQWFNEPTATVNLRNCSESLTNPSNPDGFTGDCVDDRVAIPVAKRAARRQSNTSPSAELACPMVKDKVREAKRDC